MRGMGAATEALTATGAALRDGLRLISAAVLTPSRVVVDRHGNVVVLPKQVRAERPRKAAPGLRGRTARVRRVNEPPARQRVFPLPPSNAQRTKDIPTQDRSQEPKPRQQPGQGRPAIPPLIPPRTHRRDRRGPRR